MEEIIGGYSNIKDADSNTQKMCDELKNEIEEKLQRTFEIFTAKTYREQVVAGMNYKIKIFVGNEEYIIVLIFRDLEGSPHLESVKDHMTETNEMLHF